MQKKLLKNLLLVLAITVLCFAVGMTASAEDRTIVDSGECGAQGDNVIWTLYDDGELVISGEGEMEDYTSSSDIPWEQYRYSSINSLIVENGVKSLSRCAFWQCKNLAEISLPDSLNNIGTDAFEGTVFYEDSNNWESGALYIGNHLIRVDVLCTSFVIPDNIVSVAEGAFNNCSKLISVFIGKNVRSIANGLVSCSFGMCLELKEIIVHEENKWFSNDDNGVLFNKEKSKLLKYPSGNEAVSYVVPKSVTEIDSFAFGFALNLRDIKFSDNLSIIGYGAFNYCVGLTTISIPDSVTHIDYAAFTDIYFLDKVIIKTMNATLSEYLFCPAEPMYYSGISHEDFLVLIKQYFKTFDQTVYAELEKYIVETDGIYPYLGTIYCHEGSTAETHAIANNASYVLTHFFEGDWTYDYDNMIRYRKCIHCDELETEALETTTDGDVEIIEPTDPDTDFVVDVITDYVVIEETISNNVAGDFEIVKAFDITMKNKDGVHVQPDGTVKVKLPLDWSKDGVYKVYRVNNDGTLTDMNAYRQGSHMVFETDHFSVYVIVDESEKADEPTTPDEPQEEAKKDLFSKIIDWFKSLIDLITSWFKK